MKKHFAVLLTLLNLAYNPIKCESIQLDPSNIDSILAENEFVFIYFYADWCQFCNMLSPIWDEAAYKIKEEFGNGKVVLGKIDCVKHESLGTRFHITKYPTLKYARNGQLTKREYRGQRSADAFLNFVKEQTEDPVKEFRELKDLTNVDGKNRYLIGYFKERNSLEYAHFRKSAIQLRDDCIFHAGFGETVEQMHPPDKSIVALRVNGDKSAKDEEIFKGNLQVYDEINAWVTDKCSPLVREITFENAEELTEEGLPFLILFHSPDDNESVKQYSEVVQKYLLDDKETVKFLIADGEKFAHPLYHLGKSMSDLPLIAIDSFRHMYLFPKYEDILQPGKLKQFLQDFYSGKLHREFHYGKDVEKQDSTSQSPPEKQATDKETDELLLSGDINATPPPSQFANLGPSQSRYTLLHEDL